MATTTSNIPSSMRAWTFNRRGLPTSTFTLTTDYPCPSPSTLLPNEVLIKVSHISLNIGMKALFELFPHFTSTPWIPELELSGTVVALPTAGSTEFKIGDSVMGWRTFPSMYKYGGTLVEYVVCPVNEIILKPDGVSMAEASGLPGSGCTAIQAVEAAGVKKGDKILITGGSGGVGTMLVQVCRAIVGETGYIVATCSGKNEELVQKMGADEIIDYTIHSPLHAYVSEHHKSQPFNAIFDIIGDKELHTNCPSYLTSDGFFVLLGSMAKIPNPSWFGILSLVIIGKLERFRPVLFGGIPRNHRMYNAIPEKKSLEKLTVLIDQGKFKGVVDSVWDMNEALKGYERSFSLRSRGKVVIKVES